MNSAYHDHLKRIVNISEYMTKVHSVPLEEASSTLDKLFTYALKGVYHDKDGRDWLERP